ncbi:MAG: TRAP transporter fused permease subunit [Streptosporangiales bacterium]|nr:TRAP transporter fused permease subunit [Streptosporangiales bacterium]
MEEEIVSGKRFVSLLAGLFALYSLVVISGLPNLFGAFLADAQHRAISLLCALSITYFTVSVRGKQNERVLTWDSLVLLLPGLAGAGYVAFFYDSVVEYSLYGYLDTLGIILTVALAISVLEALRRLTGWILPGLILLVVVGVYWQNYLPGLLRGPGFTLDRLTYAFYVGTGGIFGIPLGVATSIIIVFVIFGSLMQKAGAGQWLMDMAMALTGGSRGGPAKAAVVSSAFFGTISGSPSGNTATSGVFTIPLMKRTGYSSPFAGGVESVASTGGMILPPIMGSVAFIMAEFLAVPYVRVIQAALIPAILYYLVLFASVHLRALREGLRGMPKADLPAIGATFLAGWRYLIPIVVLIYVLIVMRLDPEIAASYSLLFLVASSFLTRDRRLWLTPRNIWSGLVDAVHSWRIIAIVTASVGMLLGALNLSGVGVKISSFILSLGAGNVILTLLVVGLASLVLGMGLDIIALYLTLVVLTAPALVELGLTGPQAHLYVIFWGLASFVTPPVCNAVYVACSISGSGIWETGWEAVRLGSALFVVSFAFALNPALVMDGGISEIAFAVVTALIAAVVLAAALQGYALWRMSLPQRAVFAVAGLLLLVPGAVAALTATVLVGVTVAWWRLGIKGSEARPAAAAPVESSSQGLTEKIDSGS